MKVIIIITVIFSILTAYINSLRLIAERLQIMNEHKIKLFQIISTVFILCGIIVGSFLHTEQVQAATKIELNRKYVVTSKGGTVQLQINGTSSQPQWKSSDTRIAKVTQSGMVKVLKYGTATVTATVGKKKLKCPIYSGDFWVDNLSFDDYRSNIIKLEKGGNCVVDFVFDRYIDYIPFDDLKVSVQNEGIIQCEYKFTMIDGEKCIYHIRIKGIADGKTDLFFTIGTLTKTMKVTIGTGTGKLDPVDAIKQNNYVGYSDGEAGTLKKVAEIIDQYNLKSATLSNEEKIRLIQTFLRETRDCNKQSNKDGNIANVVFNGHGNYEINEFYAYAQTFGLFCDYLGIPVKFVDGFSFLPGSTAFVPVHWNRVEINGTWYYIDTFLNALFHTSDYFLSEKLWEDHEIRDEEDFSNLYYTGNTNIKYHLLLNQEEYKEESTWEVE